MREVIVSSGLCSPAEELELFSTKHNLSIVGSRPPQLTYEDIEDSSKAPGGEPGQCRWTTAALLFDDTHNKAFSNSSYLSANGLTAPMQAEPGPARVKFGSGPALRQALDHSVNEFLVAIPDRCQQFEKA